MPFQNLTALLEKSAADVVQELRRKHPDLSHALSVARQLGEESKGDAPASRAALIELVTRSIVYVASSLDRLATKIRARMRSISRMKLVGALVASISGALAVILGYFGIGDRTISFVGAVVAMLGGLMGLFADYFERSPSGVRIAGIDEYAKLIQSIGEVELIKLKIDRDAVLPLPHDQLIAMLDKLDEYALLVIRLDRA